MQKVLSLIFILLLTITVTACGTQNNEGAKESTEKNNQVEDGTTGAGNEENVKLTEEDEKLTKLIIEKDYDTVIKETVNLETESQKNFYYLATIFTRYEEMQTKNYVDETTKEMIQSTINDFKLIINEFSEIIKESDDVTVDLLLGIQASLEKHIWMLKTTLM